MTVRYPAGPLTPHGWWHIVKGEVPLMWLTSYDGAVEMQMMGGYSIPDRYEAPECVHLTGLKGLIPPWKHITQKGATQDGVTHIDALYDPLEVEATVECWGRDARHARKVYRDLVASIDAKQQSLLNFLTLEEGHWWAPIRWFQGAPPDPVSVTRRQTAPLRLQADDSFWRTYDHSHSFQFAYEAMTDTFDVDNRATEDLGDIPQFYTGDGGGYCTSNGDRMIWVDDPDDPTTTEGREVVNGPWPGFETETDNQVIAQVHGGFQEWSVPESARNTLWGRMGHDGSDDWDGSGVRLYYGIGWIRLSYFIDFEEVAVLRQQPLLIPPLPSEKFTLVCGYEGNPRMFKVFRNNVPIMTVKESGTGSPLGPDNRGVGNGMFAAPALLTQATPAAIRKISAGDNAEVSQSGFLERVNIGDQPMYDDYILTGPFTNVKIFDGPGSDEFVEFGPLLANQSVFLRTDPRTQTTLVQDLASTPADPQQFTIFQDAMDKFLSFAGLDGAFGDQIMSLFGVKPPQGNFYKYLRGRFSENAAIPPKSASGVANPYFVRVEIQGGNADSQVIASGTPLRRFPL